MLKDFYERSNVYSGGVCELAIAAMCGMCVGGSLIYVFFFHLQRLIKSDLLTTTATTSVRARIIVCRSCPAIVVLLGRASSQLLTLPLFSCALLNWVV